MDDPRVFVQVANELRDLLDKLDSVLSDPAASEDEDRERARLDCSA